jgi:hypothetical protein
MTAVEWLVQQTPNIHWEDGYWADLFERAKEMEKEQQGYTKADMHSAWNSSEQNMRFQFGSSAYKNITFERWLLNFNEE